MSQNEYITAKRLANYFVYYVDRLDNQNPKITLIPNPIKSKYLLVRTDTFILEGTRSS